MEAGKKLGALMSEISAIEAGRIDDLEITSRYDELAEAETLIAELLLNL